MRLRIWGGFENPEDFKRCFVVDYLQDWQDAENQRLFEILTDRLFEEYRSEQATWVFPTDHDLLQQAFESMEHEGILVLQNLQSTNSSAPYEALEELKERLLEFDFIYLLKQLGVLDPFDKELDDNCYYGLLHSEPVKIKGYVYYTGYRMDDAVRGKAFYLGYQDFYENLQIKQDIAETIFRTLKTTGLQVFWDGEASRKIEVHMKWQKRA
nr:hypothetical protein [Deinococcus roseus]